MITITVEDYEAVAVLKLMDKSIVMEANHPSLLLMHKIMSQVVNQGAVPLDPAAINVLDLSTPIDWRGSNQLN
jgi:hypothetical protein